MISHYQRTKLTHAVNCTTALLLLLLLYTQPHLVTATSCRQCAPLQYVPQFADILTDSIEALGSDVHHCPCGAPVIHS